MNNEEVTRITLGNKTVNNTNGYIYLGQKIKIGNENETEEIPKRIHLGRAAFSKSKHILWNKNIPLFLTNRVFNQCMLLVHSYGVQTKTKIKANMNKQQTSKDLRREACDIVHLKIKRETTRLEKNLTYICLTAFECTEIELRDM